MPLPPPPSYYRVRGLLSMAFFSAGLVSLFAALNSAIVYWGAGGLRSSLFPTLAGVGSLLLAAALLQQSKAMVALYTAAAASLAMLTFNTTLLASNAELWSNPLTLHGRSSDILFWLIAFSGSVYLLALQKRRSAMGDEPADMSAPMASIATRRAQALPAQRAFLLFSGVVALAMIESRLQNVVGFFFFIPSLPQIDNLAALVGSFLGGALTLLVGALLLAGLYSKLVLFSALVLSLLFFVTNVFVYASGLSALPDAGGAGSLVARLSFQSLVYWSAVSYCAYRLVQRPQSLV